MAVVINEFEALAAEPASTPRAAAPDPGGEDATPEVVEPGALAAALDRLEEQALRAWAH